MLCCVRGAGRWLAPNPRLRDDCCPESLSLLVLQRPGQLARASVVCFASLLAAHGVAHCVSSRVRIATAGGHNVMIGDEELQLFRNDDIIAKFED